MEKIVTAELSISPFFHASKLTPCANPFTLPSVTDPIRVSGGKVLQTSGSNTLNDHGSCIASSVGRKIQEVESGKWAISPETTFDNRLISKDVSEKLLLKSAISSSK